MVVAIEGDEIIFEVDETMTETDSETDSERSEGSDHAMETKAYTGRGD